MHPVSQRGRSMPRDRQSIRAYLMLAGILCWSLSTGCLRPSILRSDSCSGHKSGCPKRIHDKYAVAFVRTYHDTRRRHDRALRVRPIALNGKPPSGPLSHVAADRRSVRSHSRPEPISARAGLATARTRAIRRLPFRSTKHPPTTTRPRLFSTPLSSAWRLSHVSSENHSILLSQIQSRKLLPSNKLRPRRPPIRGPGQSVRH